MTKMRVYLNPKGYEDYICYGVNIQPVLGGYQATIIGGKNDGKVIPNVCGSRVVKEHVEE